jgi:hypothetical protein
MVDRFAALVVLALCVIALSLTAATLSGAPWSDPSPGTGPGVETTPTPTPTGGDSGGGGLGISATTPPSWTIALVVFAVVVGIAAIVVLSGGRVLPMMVGVLVPVLVLVVIILTVDPEPFRQPVENVSIQNVSEMFEPGDEGGRGTGSGTVSALTYGLVGVVVLFAAGLVYFASSSVSEPEPEVETDEGTDPQDAAISAAAGAAADYIAADDRDRSNAVYEAWLEMTDALDIDAPETTTPGEFADAAVDAGMAPAEVRELTTLFEETRYGDEAPSEKREERALDALRRIEAAHAEVSGEGADDAGTGGEE